MILRATSEQVIAGTESISSKITSEYKKAAREFGAAFFVLFQQHQCRSYRIHVRLGRIFSDTRYSVYFKYAALAVFQRSGRKLSQKVHIF